MKKYRFRSCLTVFLALLLTAALFSGCSAACWREKRPIFGIYRAH